MFVSVKMDFLSCSSALSLYLPTFALFLQFFVFIFFFSHPLFLPTFSLLSPLFFMCLFRCLSQTFLMLRSIAWISQPGDDAVAIKVAEKKVQLPLSSSSLCVIDSSGSFFFQKHVGFIGFFSRKAGFFLKKMWPVGTKTCGLGDLGSSCGHLIFIILVIISS